MYCRPVLLFVDACCGISLFLTFITNTYDHQLPTSIVCFLHLNISSVLDAKSDGEIATTKRLMMVLTRLFYRVNVGTRKIIICVFFAEIYLRTEVVEENAIPCVNQAILFEPFEV